MASVDRTAYPRFKRNISVRELHEAYSPSLDEMDWARGLTGTDDHLLSLLVWLKSCQRLGYFPRPGEIPGVVAGHIRASLGLHESASITDVPDRTMRHRKSLVRHRQGLSADKAAARKVAGEAIRVAAAVKDNPADLINIALEELVRRRFELPAFSTLDRMAGDIRQEVNEGIFALIRGRMEAAARGRMLAMFTVDPVTRQSGHDKLKTTAPRASITRIGKHLDHLSWLDGVGGSTEGWLEGIPASKIAHFAGEARALDAAEMRDFGEVKRIALEVCLLHQARVAVRDDLVTMLCKRMNTLHARGRELLEQIRAEQRERNERMMAVFGEMLTAAKDVAADARTAGKPWSAVKTRYMSGKTMLAAIEANGGLADLIAEHQALAAQHGDNYLPLLERFYRSSRASLIRLASVLKLESTTTDRRLLDAVEFVKATSSRTGEYIPDSCTIIDDQTGEARRVEVDAGFAPEAWQKVVRDRRRPGKLVRRLFEICVFSCLADELVRRDVASAMSETYANWQAQLLSWEACQPYLAGYCEEVGLPSTAAEFCQGLRQQMKELAINVDAGYPDNADLLMDDEGRPSLKARKGKERTASALALEAAVKDRLPERSLLEILGRATRWLRWYRHLGPLSGSDPKLADPLERYLLVAFTYGCNLGPHQAARHLGGLVTAHELSSTARRHVSLTSLNKAIGDVVNAYLELDLPKMAQESRSYGQGQR